MQRGFYFDQSRCSGCDACTVACKQWHNHDRQVANWRWLTTLEEGKFPDVSVSFLTLTCLHCAHPACIEACPANAITKRKEDGVVLVDQNKCLGKEACGSLCLEACSYQAPKFGTEANAKMEKCDFCLDRIDAGQEPMCVSACPLRALDAGPLDELKKKYGTLSKVPGFVPDAKLGPAIVFKAKSVPAKSKRR
ncbi:MAG: 4Fe-4S dicluster domain-containing protein [Chloroflexota bacterium]